ncbi:MAG TPA: hypothetical protein VIJ59_07780 [Caulobacteraceae bacterium]
MKRGALELFATVAMSFALAMAAGTADAKPSKRRAATHKPAPAHARERPPSSTNDTSASSDSSDSASPADDRPGGEPKGSAPAGKVKTKTYTFGAMDVEGKLKTPQLLYFLNRVKLELDMSAPDKRSFMKELGQSADDKSL